jgi:hypothetical protein
MVENSFTPWLNHGHLTTIEADNLNVVGVHFIVTIGRLEYRLVTTIVSILSYDGHDTTQHDSE